MYITAVLLGVAVWLLSGVTGDVRVDHATVLRVIQRGPQVVGAVIGVSLAIGLRSGGRGGPLVIEAADVRHVLLSPVDRAVALRPVAIRQLRFGPWSAPASGAMAGLLAYRRLPGGFVAWVASGAAVGLVVAAASLGLAMVVAGRRWGRWVGTGLGRGGGGVVGRRPGRYHDDLSGDAARRRRPVAAAVPARSASSVSPLPWSVWGRAW